MKFDSINGRINIIFTEISRTKQGNIKYDDCDLNNMLTQREIECLSYIAHGFTMKMIAKKLNISPRTVEQHLRNLKEKFELNTKGQLVELWYRLFSS